ncbi:putative mitochondrial-processing peptidase subunit beta, mitochondrial [Wolffia australiana]
MIFKGTENLAVEQREETKNMGGHLNAYISREQTTYYAKVAFGDVPKAMEILANILQNSRFSEASINWERNVILCKMEEVEGQAEEVIFDHLQAGFPIHSIGPDNTGLSPDYQDHYSASSAGLHINSLHRP